MTCAQGADSLGVAGGLQWQPSRQRFGPIGRRRAPLLLQLDLVGSLPGCAGQEGGDNVGGVAVEGYVRPVITHGRSEGRRGWLLLGRRGAGRRRRGAAVMKARVLTGADGPFGVSGAPTDLDAVRTDGGWRIDARFRFMTGSADARWCTGLGLDGNAPEAGMYAFVMPMSDLTVTDNWVEASAMRGTGSNAVVGQGVFVPDERVVSLTQSPRIDRPLFRVAPFVILWMPCAAMGDRRPPGGTGRLHRTCR